MSRWVQSWVLLLRYTPIEGSSEGTGSPTNNHLNIKKPPPLNPCVENNMSCAREVPSESLIISKKLFFKPTLREPRRRRGRRVGLKKGPFYLVYNLSVARQRKEETASRVSAPPGVVWCVRTRLSHPVRKKLGQRSQAKDYAL